MQFPGKFISDVFQDGFIRTALEEEFNGTVRGRLHLTPFLTITNITEIGRSKHCHCLLFIYIQ
jgi:hypothetical protein